VRTLRCTLPRGQEEPESSEMLVTFGHVIGVVLTFAVSRALSLGVYVSTWVTHNGFIQSHIHGEGETIYSLLSPLSQLQLPTGAGWHRSHDERGRSEVTRGVF
jgi:hypothetical protein